MKPRGAVSCMIISTNEAIGTGQKTMQAEDNARKAMMPCAK